MKYKFLLFLFLVTIIFQEIHGKRKKKHIQKILKHAPGLLSKADAQLQGHLSHHKHTVKFADRHLNLQDLTRQLFNSRIVLPKPVISEQTSTTPLNKKVKHHHHQGSKHSHKSLKEPNHLSVSFEHFKPTKTPHSGSKKHLKKHKRPKKFRKYLKHYKKYAKKHRNKHRY